MRPSKMRPSKMRPSKMRPSKMIPSKKGVQTTVANCHFELQGIKHTESSSEAIIAIANALDQNAKALKELSKSLSGSGIGEINFGHCINMDSPRG